VVILGGIVFFMSEVPLYRTVRMPSCSSVLCDASFAVQVLTHFENARCAPGGVHRCQNTPTCPMLTDYLNIDKPGMWHCFSHSSMPPDGRCIYLSLSLSLFLASSLSLSISPAVSLSLFLSSHTGSDANDPQISASTILADVTSLKGLDIRGILCPLPYPGLILVCDQVASRKREPQKSHSPNHLILKNRSLRGTGSDALRKRPANQRMTM